MAPPLTGNAVTFVATDTVDDVPVPPPVQGPTGWINYYHELAKIDPDRDSTLLSRHGIYDTPSRDIVDDEAEFLNVILANQGFNFALVPSSTKGDIQILHNCFVYEDDKGSNSVIAIKGLHFTSPWKVIPIKEAISSIKVTSTRSKPSHFPTLEQFLSCSTAALDDKFRRVYKL